MAKIVVKKPDGGIVIILTNDNKFGDKEGLRPFSECSRLAEFIDPKHPNFYGEVCDWYVSDETIDKSDIESRKQLYHDGSNKIKKDLNWEHRLMPDHLIKKKHLSRLESKIKSELKNKNLDFKKLSELNIHHAESVKKNAGIHNEDPFWIDVAISNLDENVANGKKDKKNIRNKLEQLKAKNKN